MTNWRRTIVGCNGVKVDIWWQFCLKLSSGKTHDMYSVYTEDNNLSVLIIGYVASRTGIDQILYP